MEDAAAARGPTWSLDEARSTIASIRGGRVIVVIELHLASASTSATSASLCGERGGSCRSFVGLEAASAFPHTRGRSGNAGRGSEIAARTFRTDY